jgi:hypothetical protein
MHKPYKFDKNEVVTPIPEDVQDKIKKKEKFTDESFQPNEKSIGKEKGKKFIRQLDWKRVAEIEKEECKVIANGGWIKF